MMAIIKAVLDLARSLKVRTTAEGIETELQRIWLQAHGCSEGQAYLFARPMAATQIAGYLDNERAQQSTPLTHTLRRA